VVNLVLLALAAAVYPTLLAAVILILILTRANPLRMLVAFLIGGMAISIVAGFALVRLPEASDAVSKSHSASKPIGDIVIGAASLLVARGVSGAATSTRLPQTTRPRATARRRSAAAP
jgi:hypothetical protein